MRYVMMIAVILLMSACQTESNDEIEPEMPDQVEVITETPEAPPDEPSQPTATPQVIERQPLPPTWTPTPRPGEDGEIDDESAQTTGALLSRPTGEWTPVFIPTRSPACGDFRAQIPEQRLVLMDDVASASWNPMAGAMLYRYVIFDDDEEIIYERLIEESQHTVSASIFPFEGVFGWFVEPLDPIGFVMCAPQGDLFFVEAP